MPTVTRRIAEIAEVQRYLSKIAEDHLKTPDDRYEEYSKTSEDYRKISEDQSNIFQYNWKACEYFLLLHNYDSLSRIFS